MVTVALIFVALALFCIYMELKGLRGRVDHLAMLINRVCLALALQGDFAGARRETSSAASRPAPSKSWNVVPGSGYTHYDEPALSAEEIAKIRDKIAKVNAEHGWDKPKPTRKKKGAKS